jgi:hypothetical protein
MLCIVKYASGMFICILGYVKSVMRYKFVILGTYHPDTVYLCQQVCEGPRLFFEAYRVPREKEFGNNDQNSRSYYVTIYCD